MMHSQTPELQLERLLKYGTIFCSVVIIIGVVLDALGMALGPFDPVMVGIVGFIALPVIRVLSMLAHYASSKDKPMTQVTALVLTLIATGLVLGIFW